MSEPRGDLDELDGDLRDYVAAFRSVERPDERARRKTWAAIESRVAGSHRAWWWSAAVVAAAAVVVWIFGGLGQGLLPATDPASDMQTQYDQTPHGTDGSAVSREPAPAPPTRVRTPAPEPPPELAEPTPEPTPETTVPEPAAAPPAKVPSPRTRRARPEKTRPDDAPIEADASALAEETRLFREIQQALVAGAPKAALSAIERHAQRFPNGVFRHERTVAKARALCALGRTAKAQAIRDRFVTKRPRSHLTPRMREVCRD